MIFKFFVRLLWLSFYEYKWTTALDVITILNVNVESVINGLGPTHSNKSLLLHSQKWDKLVARCCNFTRCRSAQHNPFIRNRTQAVLKRISKSWQKLAYDQVHCAKPPLQPE
ncbi:hypothetical protein CDAR_560991 [Caerostris darwini]|uniref:Uncharacterized protein n=1 Tax=Caerostris darwini TaxID=1538125 RepID=A0AAV4TF00_9ARAC|nr:hypothetical protein CDAR_560991 [Caerostris darwini]